mgnify:CR=1 FL=1
MLEHATKALESLHQAINEIEARLSVVCAPLGPTGTNDDAKEPSGVPLAAVLLRITNQIAGAESRVRMLLTRLEI